MTYEQRALLEALREGVQRTLQETDEDDPGDRVCRTAAQTFSEIIDHAERELEIP